MGRLGRYHPVLPCHQGTLHMQSAHCLAACQMHTPRSYLPLQLCQQSMQHTHSVLHLAVLQHYTAYRLRWSQLNWRDSSHSIAGSRLVSHPHHTARTSQLHLTWYRVDSFGRHSDRCSARFPHCTGCSRPHRRCTGPVHSLHTRPAHHSPAYLERTTGMIPSLHQQCHRCDDVFR